MEVIYGNKAANKDGSRKRTNRVAIIVNLNVLRHLGFTVQGHLLRYIEIFRSDKCINREVVR